MTGKCTTRRVELACCAIFLGVAAALGWAAAGIEASPFDPIGSGRIPLVLSVLLGALSLLLIAGGARQVAETDGAEIVARPGPPLSVAGLTALYVVALDAGRLPFVAVSAGFLLSVGAVLSLGRLRPRRAAVLLVVAVSLPALVAYLFTHVLYIRLP